MKISSLVLLLIAGCVGLTAADAPRPSAKVMLWPGHPPGAIADPAYVEEIVYRDAEKTQARVSKVTEPTLEIYLPPADKANGTGVIICPGGGYSVLAYDHEGIQVAEFFNRLGIAAFILKYRLPSDAIMQDKSVGPLQDAQEAIRTVRRRAADFAVDPAKIGIMGFSAGGHLAASATVLHDWTVYPATDATSARPDFSILVYPVISMQADLSHGGSRKNLLGAEPDAARMEKLSIDRQVNERTPPTFLIHSVDDRTVLVENSINYVLAAKKHKVPVELHVYPTGGHGYGLGVSPQSPRSWPEVLKTWLKANGWLPAATP